MRMRLLGSLLMRRTVASRAGPLTLRHARVAPARAPDQAKKLALARGPEWLFWHVADESQAAALAPKEDVLNASSCQKASCSDRLLSRERRERGPPGMV